MTLGQNALAAAIKGLTGLLCRVDAAELERVPEQGPLILVGNHVNFLEVPVVYTRLRPRPMAVLVKAQSWAHPFLGLFFKIFGGRNAIPLRIGEADRQALQRGMAALEAGQILVVAPEGTRSGDGRLQQGHPGVVSLALHCGAPILPIAYHGSERFWHNLLRLRRTDFIIRVGHPFYLEPGSVRVTREVRQQMADEIMYQMAALLPPAYRGAYANLEAGTEAFLRFPEGSGSNLRAALGR